MNNSYNILINKLDVFIKKYYKNMLIKGGIYSLGLLSLFFVVTTTTEYLAELNPLGRTILFYVFVLASLYVIYTFILVPLAKLYNIGKKINHKQAAEIIGQHFATVQDKLLNILQLKDLHNSAYNATLLEASINQKAQEISPVPFSSAINFSENKKHLKILIVPSVLILLIVLISPNVFTEGTQRLVYHNQTFAPKAPFNFLVINKNLEVLKNKDFVLNVKVEGKELPNKIYIEQNNNKISLVKKEKNRYEHTFKNVKENQTFHLYASGFYSNQYKLEVLPNPILNNFKVTLEYPKYLKKPAETIKNIGDLILPEGTKAQWSFKTEDASSLSMFINDSLYVAKTPNNKAGFSFTIRKTQQYYVSPKNTLVTKNDTVFYNLEVILDKAPTILINEKLDSVSHKRIYFKGNIKDDYGFTALNFYYRIKNENRKGSFVKKESLKIDKTINLQDFYYYINVDELTTNKGDEVEYYFEVWDNDQVNGYKSAKTIVSSLKTKTENEIKEQISENNNDIKSSLTQSIEQANKLKQDMDELRKKMLEKKELGWNEKQKIKELLEKQKQLEKDIEEIKNKNQQNNLNKLDIEQNEDIIKKQDLLQKLFEELMTEEMKEMYEELQKLMEKLDKNAIEKELEKMEMSNKDIEKELDRSLELFKQLEVEQKIEDIKEKLDELKEKQQELSKKTEEKQQDKDSLKAEQDKLNEEFEKLKEELDKATKLDKELEQPKGLDKTSQKQDEVSNEMNKSSEELQKGKESKASESQQKAAEKMEELSEQLSAMQSSSDSTGEDMESLRQLLENLLHLSFKQEDLLHKTKQTSIKSPEYVSLVQEQKEIKDDAKMIEDSLFALSKRVVQLESIVNREMTSINSNMEKTIEYMADRKPPMASSRQQYIMTSINNLALILDDAVQQMQQQMQQKQGKGSCDKPGAGGKPKPGAAKSLKKMQEQLNQQLKQMKEAMQKGKKPGDKPGEMPGMPGSGMSKSLAKMAAQQAKIRQQIQKLMNEQQNAGAKKGLNGLSKLMEETEKDLVNKRVTQQTIQRQQEILTRLLEHEKAEKEREKDDKRESKTSKNIEKRNIEEFFEYNMMKKNEVDLLQTKPANMSLFYKNKVTDYFQNISHD